MKPRANVFICSHVWCQISGVSGPRDGDGKATEAELGLVRDSDMIQT